MNDKLPIILATSVLAFGGLGLYMYKQMNDADADNTEDNHDSVDSIEEDPEFNFSDFFGFVKNESPNKDEDDKSYVDTDSDNYELYEQKRKNLKTNAKEKATTKRNKKSKGLTKRRH